jgi:hypothetical protein
MKLILIVALLIPIQTFGDWRSFSDLEFLNDIGLTDVGRVGRTANHTLNVLGRPQTGSRINSAKINRGYGNADSFIDQTTGRRMKLENIPTFVSEIQDLLRYIQ